MLSNHCHSASFLEDFRIIREFEAHQIWIGSHWDILSSIGAIPTEGFLSTLIDHFAPSIENEYLKIITNIIWVVNIKRSIFWNVTIRSKCIVRENLWGAYVK